MDIIKNEVSDCQEADLKKTMNIQDLFLNVSRKEKIPITVFLMNGFQIRGFVKGFDTYVIVLDSDGKTNMIYKHAVSTIVPSKPISLMPQ